MSVDRHLDQTAGGAHYADDRNSAMVDHSVADDIGEDDSLWAKVIPLRCSDAAEHAGGARDDIMISNRSPKDGAECLLAGTGGVYCFFVFFQRLK